MVKGEGETGTRKAATNGRRRCVSSESLLVSVSLDVVLSGFGCVVGRMGVVSLGYMRVVGGRFVIAILMVLSSFSVVVGGVLVMLGSLAMMMRCFLRHNVFLSLARGSEEQTSACRALSKEMIAQWFREREMLVNHARKLVVALHPWRLPVRRAKEKRG
jgi:hypothetical protein